MKGIKYNLEMCNMIEKAIENGKTVTFETKMNCASEKYRKVTVKSVRWDGMIFTNDGVITFGIDLIRNLEIA